MVSSTYMIRRLENRPVRTVEVEVNRGTTVTRPSSLAAIEALQEIERLNGGVWAGKTYKVPGETLEVLSRLIKWGFNYSTPEGSNVAGTELR